LVAGDFKLPIDAPEEAAPIISSEPDPVPETEPAAPDAAVEASPPVIDGSKAEVAAKAAPPPSPVAEIEDEAVLELPDDEPAEDPMKTMIVTGGSTSDNIKIPDLPAAEPDAPAEELLEANEPKPESAPKTPPSFKPDLEAETMMAPKIPQFSEPELKPPDVSGPLDPPTAPPAEPTASQKPSAPKSPPAPIPSPFEDSMPPGVVAPDTPPFEPKASAETPKPLNKPAASPPASPFADPSAPVADSGTEDWGIDSSPRKSAASGTAAPDPFGSNSILSDDSSSADAEGEDKMLAIISLVTGILSMLCCASIITGPAALITGYLAKGKIKEDPNAYGGGTLATIGMISGVVGILLTVGLTILWIAGIISQ
jgi:hypothetical protein